jgi:hypothetical protein
MNGDRRDEPVGDRYTPAIGALADEARMAPASAARIERELLSAFADHHGAAEPDRAVGGRSEWRAWLAAAAALIAIAGSVGVWRFNARVTVNDVTEIDSSLKAATPSGFVELPGAAGLPDFESGAIVRVELVLASLPAYGIDISRAGGDQPVEADVLVGQDGQPRAIRLVTNSSRSGQ